MGENAVERCALISVWDKTGIVEFAQKLQAQGFTIISTGGTKTTLQAAGIPVTGVEEVTGVPEMLGGRVKTLHPAIMAGILARRQEPEDRSALAALGYPLIDIVVVNFYPFKQVVADGGATFPRQWRISTSAAPVCCGLLRRTTSSFGLFAIPGIIPGCWMG